MLLLIFYLFNYHVLKIFTKADGEKFNVCIETKGTIGIQQQSCGVEFSYRSSIKSCPRVLPQQNVVMQSFP